MKALSILDEVARELEQNPNVIRIKRLILYVCNQTWENDLNKLASLDLTELIQDLWVKSIKIEDIEIALNRLVSKVNKKSEYSEIAQQIIEQIGRLYAEPEESTEILPGGTVFSPEQTYLYGTQMTQFEGFSAPVSFKPSRDPGDLFDVRQKILQRTNPLKAKIVLQSALDTDFTFNDRDWSSLKNQDLEALLRQIFQVCKTTSELESTLENIANRVNNLEGAGQAASIIIQALTPCYEKQELLRAPLAPSSEPVSTPSASPTPVVSEEPSYFKLGEITMLAAPNPYENNENSDKNFLPSPPSLIPSIYSKETEDDSNDTTNDTTSDLSDPPLPSYPVSEVTVPSEDSEFSLSSIKISQSIKQKISLEEQIKGLVSPSVDRVIETMEETLKSLENDLKQRLINQSPDQRLLHKYKALREFIGNVQEMTSQFMEVISEFESTEMQQLPPHLRKIETKTPPPEKNQSNKILEMAKQGNPKAIAAWFNQVLQPKGITVLAMIKDGCLHIVLEAGQIPPQHDASKFIEKKLLQLSLTSINLVKVHGRLTGQKSVTWTQQITLAT
jgi:hypothetical protein